MNPKRVVKVLVICVQPKLSPILYQLVGRISKLDMMLLWFTADTAEAMTMQLLPLFLDIKKKDGSAYLLCHDC